MSHTRKEEIICALFTPYEDKFSFVREAISNTVIEINKNIKESDGESPFYEYKDLRVDDIPETRGSKVTQIIKLIEKCDIAIVDITNERANVYWELGYCTAMDKPIIIICQKFKGTEFYDNIAFNIKNREVKLYDLSVKGLIELEKYLFDVLISELELILPLKKSLAVDKDINSVRQEIIIGLKEIDKNSLLKSLVLGEFERLNGRMKRLKNGFFDLRNRKPLSEIINYYSNYVSQLNEEGATFDTITLKNFWKNITNNYSDFTYFEANKSAAQKGTIIRRIFILQKDDLLNSDPFYNSVLLPHFNMTRRNKRFQAKVYICLDKEEFDTIIDDYPNLAIWTRNNNQHLLFRPRHKGDDFERTDFYYYEDGNYSYEENKKQIDDSANFFKRIWENEQSLPLEDVITVNKSA